MKLLTSLKHSLILRQYSSVPKPEITACTKVISSIEHADYKPRRHPGIHQVKTVFVPDKLVKAIQNVTEDFPIKKLVSDGEALTRHLKAKVPPMEPDQIKELRDQFYSKIMSEEEKKHKDNPNFVQEDEKCKQRIKDRVIDKLKKKVYNWSPVTYDAYNSLVYLLARFPAEYAVLVKLFAEIQQRDRDFKPRSFFDFGSGTGTAMWACNLHWDKLFEYVNVDTSSFMNDLSLLLVQDGRPNKETVLKGVFYRQFLPQNNKLYDIVVSAYSLLELHSFQVRMETAMNLWNKTGKYLILVEQGTNAGFRIINEIRDYILQLDGANKGHVFSPCPHEFTCPRFMQDNTPCNFQISYSTLPIGMKPEIRKELYTYIILKKGERDANAEDDSQWPRVVRETMVRARHTICRMCTKHGTLDEVIFTASKHGKTLYHCARSTKWGDRLPIDVKQNSTLEEHVENDD